ncbi:MAG: alanine racemase [Alphaproteobacteria bacterium]|nr:alanine racemase [Alphaproteobacteria bacterium]
MPGPARLTINLASLAKNYRILAERFSGQSVACVVKADAYGLGAAPVASRLRTEGCSFFFVATLDEAIELRGVVETPIGVFAGPFPGEEKEYVNHRLMPVLNDLGQITRWKNAAPGAACILQADTGMHRMGISLNEQQKLRDDPALLEGLAVFLSMSHMACADTSDHPLNGQQLKQFQRFRALTPDARASLANSATVFLDKAYHFDIARPGCALYGINPTPGTNPMQPVVWLEAPVLAVRDIDAGESVGYGAAWLAQRPSRIATVALGYADGFLRSGGNNALAYLGENPAPVVGRISMDLITLDVTDLPESAYAPGSMASFLNERYTVDDLARDCGTIGYEILTRLGRRFERVYA